MTCKDCYHYEACGGFLPSDTDKDVWDLCAKGKADEISDIEERCSEFENKADLAKVTRCKNCKHFITDTFKRTMCNRTFTMFEMNENDFCSYGEI